MGSPAWTGNALSCTQLQVRFVFEFEREYTFDNTEHLDEFVPRVNWGCCVGWFDILDNTEAAIGLSTTGLNSDTAARECVEPVWRKWVWCCRYLIAHGGFSQFSHCYYSRCHAPVQVQRTGPGAGGCGDSAAGTPNL